MSYDVTIPSLGESVSEATIGRWLKDDGDLVAADEAILELESDKANMDLAAEQPGVLRILKPAGETVSEGDVVARIESAASGAADSRARSGDGGPAPSERPVASAPKPAPAPAPRSAPTSATAPAPKPATAPAAKAPGDGAAARRPPTPAARAERPSGGPESEAALPKEDHEPSEVGTAIERPLSPAVRRIAEEANLDLRGASGSGPGGRVTKADAAALAAGGRAAPSRAAPAPVEAKSAPQPPAAPSPGEERVRMSRIRQVIARRLVEAQQTAAILTTFNELDMTAVQALRARYKDAFQSRHGVPLGFMSFFVKACCEAATRVPELNAEIQGDEIVYRRHVHMGVAVGTEKGLVVPVVRDADRLSFAEIEKEIARLAGLARDGKLGVADLSGATFTISNGGVYGSLLSTPILNPPQSGILGMHKIEKRPVVVDDEIVIRPMMYLALSYDHRIVDGKGAVTFLVRVKEALEDPARLLIGA
jgi:2-oxoglutarate dehydrogenase E2 component (dihydrolipoamide succinyltransferase)